MLLGHLWGWVSIRTVGFSPTCSSNWGRPTSRTHLGNGRKRRNTSCWLTFHQQTAFNSTTMLSVFPPSRPLSGVAWHIVKRIGSMSISWLTMLTYFRTWEDQTLQETCIWLDWQPLPHHLYQALFLTEASSPRWFCLTPSWYLAAVDFHLKASC